MSENWCVKTTAKYTSARTAGLVADVGALIERYDGPGSAARAAEGTGARLLMRLVPAEAVALASFVREFDDLIRIHLQVADATLYRITGVCS